jgi:putative colanic acid biosynthesis UDP-glucose lipid carrier transferase
MTPVMVKRTFLMVLLVGVQTVIPAIVAVACLLAVARLWHVPIDTDPTTTLVVIALSCLTLIHPPRELASQLRWQALTETSKLLGRWILLLLIMFSLAMIDGDVEQYPRGAALAWALGTPLLMVGSLLLVHSATHRAVTAAVRPRRVVFAGYNRTSLALADSFVAHPEMRLQVVGYFDDRDPTRLSAAAGAPLLGRLGELAGFAKRSDIDLVFLSLPLGHIARVSALVEELHDTTVSIYYVPDLFVYDLINARPVDLNGIPVVAMRESPLHGFNGTTKRLMDFVMALVILTLALPLLLLLALLVWLTSRGPVMFRQRRYGLDGQEIVVYKFRTMTVTEDGQDIRQASRGDPRITPVGSLLRRFSLDELPQLINVLQGRMSLVGPRPHAVAHNEQYRKLVKGYMVRHKILPGITGLAQVNGARGEITDLKDLERRVRYDLDYFRNWSPLLDLKIMLLTVARVFRDRNAF